MEVLHGLEFPRGQRLEESRISLFLMVKDTIRIVNLLDTLVALGCPDRQLLVILDDLLRKGLRRRRRNYLRFSS